MTQQKQHKFDYRNVFELPSLELIKIYADRALACCPKEMQKSLKNTSIVVENVVSKSLLKKLEISSPGELLGLYKVYEFPTKCELTLFRCPLIMYSISSNEDIGSVVARVTVYEISHRSQFSGLSKQWLNSIKTLPSH
jgi:predicted Zn-dependent protease with MMP-like domain